MAQRGPDIQRPNGKMSWQCDCGQMNNGWCNECGRCEQRRDGKPIPPDPGTANFTLYRKALEDADTALWAAVGDGYKGSLVQQQIAACLEDLEGR